jgi:hypothetical protein
MTQSFDIVTSGTISAALMLSHLESLLPDCKVVVTQGEEDTPDQFPVVWVRAVATSDPDWPCMLRFFAFPSESRLGPYPDLRLAEALSAWFGVQSLCDTHGLVPGLDPHDPYWFLAWADGSWHLADAGDTPLMGPYTDGTRTFPGDQKVRLKQRVELPG